MKKESCFYSLLYSHLLLLFFFMLKWPKCFYTQNKVKASRFHISTQGRVTSCCLPGHWHWGGIRDEGLLRCETREKRWRRGRRKMVMEEKEVEEITNGRSRSRVIQNCCSQTDPKESLMPGRWKVKINTHPTDKCLTEGIDRERRWGRNPTPSVLLLNCTVWVFTGPKSCAWTPKDLETSDHKPKKKKTKENCFFLTITMTSWFLKQFLLAIFISS